MGLIDTPALQHVFQRSPGRDRCAQRTEADHVENRSILDTTGLAHEACPRWTLNGSNSPVPALTPLAVPLQYRPRRVPVMLRAPASRRECRGGREALATR